MMRAMTILALSLFLGAIGLNGAMAQQTTSVPGGQYIAVPRVDDTLQLQLLEDIACACLDYWGLSAERYGDEAQARNDVERLAREGRWPLLLTPLDTGGEKPFEEFVGADESAIDWLPGPPLAFTVGEFGSAKSPSRIS